jgi:hypothetical protein
MILFTTRYILPPRRLKFLGEEIRSEEKVKYMGVTLDRRLTWSSHIDQGRRKASQRLGVLSPLLDKCSGLAIRKGLMLYVSSFVSWWTTLAQFGDMLLTVTWRSFNTFSPNACVLLLAHLGMLAIYSCMRTGGSVYSWTHQESCIGFWL